ncbi:MAG TPA: DUF4412 domain-containing protein [Bacteroidota bacterium]|nr:DUF4412 domain-containing protein [Bacteroidota bacterium]
MRLKTPVILLMVLGFIPLAHGQFQGILDMKVVATSADTVQTATYRLQIGGSNIAAEFHDSEPSMPNGKFIFRGDRNVLWIVDDDSKNYIEMSTASQEGQDRPKGGQQADSGEKLRPTGKTQKMLGYPCEELVTHEHGAEVRILATTKLGDVYEGLSRSLGQLGGRNEGSAGGWEHQLAALKMFPLKVTTTHDVRTRETQEVTAITPAAVDSTVFLPPEGYKKELLDMNMEKMLDEMKNQAGTDSTADTTGNR